MDKQLLGFPKEFFWGSAISSYQVEGGIEDNDWAEAARENRVPRAGLACDHYTRFEEDFDIAKSLNQNAHRFSIEWSRIEPEEEKWSKKEIEHYRRVLEALRERNIEPFVTLWHFTLPTWFSKIGGWENKKSPDIFARYIEFVVGELKDLAKFWITINEPLVYIGEGYLRKRWLPQKCSIFSALKVYRNLLSAHRKSFDVIKNISKESEVGIAKHLVYYLPAREKSFFDKKLVSFMESIDLRYLDKIQDKQDFIGLNYYRPRRIKFNLFKPGNFFTEDLVKEPVNDMGWEICPRGIYEILKKLKKYNKPIYVTENGIADAKDSMREKYIKEHLYYTHQAIREGVDVRGYFYWSLLDNFEWADSYGPKFGLVDIDFETQKRAIRPSAYKYAEICKTNSLTSNA